MRGTIVAQIAISQADKSVQKREIIMGKHLFLDWGDETNAVCRHCGHPFGSWSVIEKGFCPGCHATITEEEKKNSWCAMCGGALRPDERGMGECWNCIVGD